LLAERAHRLELRAFDVEAGGGEIDLVGGHGLDQADDLALRVPELAVERLTNGRSVGGERRPGHAGQGKKAGDGSKHSSCIPVAGLLYPTAGLVYTIKASLEPSPLEGARAMQKTLGNVLDDRSRLVARFSTLQMWASRHSS